MAPESERAKWPNGTEQRKNGDCYYCGFPKYQHTNGTDCPPRETAYQPNPNEPTLTCSEVVERLRNEAYVAENWIVKRKSSFDVTKAEAILHSWRERRVQELEGCLLGLSLTLEKLVLPRIVDALKDFDNPQMVGIVHKKDLYWLPLAQGHLESSIKEIQQTLAKSDEWREQVRKGAKHE